jgi:hypothetical protein
VNFGRAARLLRSVNQITMRVLLILKLIKQAKAALQKPFSLAVSISNQAVAVMEALLQREELPLQYSTSTFAVSGDTAAQVGEALCGTPVDTPAAATTISSNNDNEASLSPVTPGTNFNLNEKYANVDPWATVNYGGRLLSQLGHCRYSPYNPGTTKTGYQNGGP